MKILFEKSVLNHKFGRHFVMLIRSAKTQNSAWEPGEVPYLVDTGLCLT